MLIRIFSSESQNPRVVNFSFNQALCFCVACKDGLKSWLQKHAGKSLVSFLLLFALFNPVQAKIESLQFDTPQMEADYNVLIDELRCLVCQNQNLADSNAELAQDLRKQTYEMLQQGKSREQVVDFMVTRYGDFVLYRPPFKLTTLLLWLGPLVLLLIALTIVFVFFRKQQSSIEIPEQQKTRAHSLLDD